MISTSPEVITPSESLLDGIVEKRAFGLSILSPTNRQPIRRVLYVNSYGGTVTLDRIKQGLLPPHHLWGCVELVRKGYEVGLAETLLDFYLHRNPFPHDLKFLKAIKSWLGNDGVIYCGHNVLYWLPFLTILGAVRSPIVSLLFAREPLKFARHHAGIIGLTKSGAEHARKLAPRVNVANLAWGVDLTVYPGLRYRPEIFFSCGIAMRDFETLSYAARQSDHRVEIVVPGTVDGVTWPANVNVTDGGKGWNFEKDRLSHEQLLNVFHARSIASMILVKRDDAEYTACGFTELLDAMAMARPVIMTKTGALPSEIDIEKAGCGMFVPPGSPSAVAAAMDYLANNPMIAEEMGRKGRRLAEDYYNIERYAADLHRFFEAL